MDNVQENPWDSGLDDVLRCMQEVGSNLNGLLDDLNSEPEFVALLESRLLRLKNNVRCVSRNLEQTLSHYVSQYVSQQRRLSLNAAAMADQDKEIVELRAQVKALQRENKKLTAQLEVKQGENARLQAQLTNQSIFCGSLGAVLGNLLWKVSRIPQNVELILAGNKAATLLCIVSSALDSFLETFDTNMPLPTANENQFIMAMGGIVTNIAASPVGRQFLVSDPNGRDLILQILKMIPAVPTSGHCLKRLLLMTLYNISINQEGLTLLLQDGKGTIFCRVAEGLKPESSRDLQLTSLRLLVSLTSDIHDPALLAQVPMELVSKVTHSADDELQSTAQEVQANMLRATERIAQNSTRAV